MISLILILSGICFFSIHIYPHTHPWILIDKNTGEKIRFKTSLKAQEWAILNRHSSAYDWSDDYTLIYYRGKV